jgi:transcriptional regulator with PAS, ATPase and Fis domain
LSSFLRDTGHGATRPERERISVKQQLESLVSEMVEKGILFVDARREFEKRFIARVLLRHKGNLSRAAKDLRIHRNTLGKKIEEYNLGAGS